MSKNNANSRSDGHWGVVYKFNKKELKSVEKDIYRADVKDPKPFLPIVRDLADPSLLKIHFKFDKSNRSIFDRDNVLVNTILTQQDYVRGTSRVCQSSSFSSSSSSSSASSVSSTDDIAELVARAERSMMNPQSKRSSARKKLSCQKNYVSLSLRNNDRGRSRSPRRRRQSTSPLFSTRKSSRSNRSRHSRSPRQHSDNRRSRSLVKSKSPFFSTRRSRRSKSRTLSYCSRSNRSRHSRSPRQHSDNRRSRSPAKSNLPYFSTRRSRRSESETLSYCSRSNRSRPSRSSRQHTRRSRRSQSRTLSYRSRSSRSRHSKSPRQHSESRRSRSLVKKHSRYTLERRSRRSSDDKMHPRPPVYAPYFQGTEFWTNPTYQPRFNQKMIPVGPFFYGSHRAPMPIMMSQRQYRPRIIYNNRTRFRLPTPAITTTGLNSNVAVTAAFQPDDTRLKSGMLTVSNPSMKTVSTRTSTTAI